MSWESEVILGVILGLALVFAYLAASVSKQLLAIVDYMDRQNTMFHAMRSAMQGKDSASKPFPSRTIVDTVGSID